MRLVENGYERKREAGLRLQLRLEEIMVTVMMMMMMMMMMISSGDDSHDGYTVVGINYHHASHRSPTLSVH